MKLLTLVSITAAVGLLAACSSKAAPTSTPSLPALPPQVATSPAATIAPGQTVAPQGFFLVVSSPADETVVATSALTTKGQTSPDAVVSVNGQVATVDGDGNFTASVTLQQGPNSIDVIASDFYGNQKSMVVNVIYAP